VAFAGLLASYPNCGHIFAAVMNTPQPPDESASDARVLEALVRLGLAENGETPIFERLTGGVSSDIWRVDLAGGPICVKRALAKLRVEADWRAPVERNAYEAEWMRRAASAVPSCAPQLLGQDADSGTLAMAYLNPADHPLWKSELLAGRVDAEFAASVAAVLGGIHAATAGVEEISAALPTDQIFHDIRLEPYLLHTATAHPGLAEELKEIAATTAANKLCLVHGDVSPKNILIGPDGPVFLDAECAWYGDPAFDVAFCLNHLLLKCLARPDCVEALMESFRRFVAVYLDHIDWEPPGRMEARAAHLLPALFLARVDGKSPAEYVTDEGEKNLIRRTACGLLEFPPDRLMDVAAAWHERLTR